jgi:hypothetical protein
VQIPEAGSSFAADNKSLTQHGRGFWQSDARLKLKRLGVAMSALAILIIGEVDQ